MSQFLYHYCSTQAAFSILNSRIFRLSALSAANDSLEGRVLGNLFSKLLRSAEISKGIEDVSSIIVQGYADSTEGFAYCLSENGDLLSQWRAYANDGTGLSIGFCPEILTKDFGPVNFGSQFYELVKVEYGEQLLKETLEPYIEKIKSIFARYGDCISLKNDLTKEKALRIFSDREQVLQKIFESRTEKGLNLLNELLKTLAPLHFLIYRTKPYSFHEEREWRLLRYRHRVALEDIQYSANDLSVRPFIACLIADPAREAIREVILGPKHRSDINWMRAFLSSVGMPHIRVLRSEIESYR